MKIGLQKTTPKSPVHNQYGVYHTVDGLQIQYSYDTPDDIYNFYSTQV